MLITVADQNMSENTHNAIYHTGHQGSLSSCLTADWKGSVLFFFFPPLLLSLFFCWRGLQKADLLSSSHSAETGVQKAFEDLIRYGCVHCGTEPLKGSKSLLPFLATIRADSYLSFSACKLAIFIPITEQKE